MSAHDRSTTLKLDIESVLDRLVELGYRATSPRREVVATVLDQDRPFTSEQIVHLLPHIGRATVYRTLEILASIDVVHRLLKPGGFPAYVVGHPGHRHHLVCSGCATVVEFSDCPVETLVQDLADRTEFTISTHHLEITGVCPTCQQAAN
ncbi:MAG: transcriptional repressor [Thermomicrobiales bacterium]|nr:transcriptional repressor [Thermomicrobiales bacterium]MCC6944402.1 transcriptional repressor [Thermomicrobiales bacterium]